MPVIQTSNVLVSRLRTFWRISRETYRGRELSGSSLHGRHLAEHFPIPDSAGRADVTKLRLTGSARNGSGRLEDKLDVDPVSSA